MLYSYKRVNDVLEHHVQFKILAKHFTQAYCKTRGKSFSSNESRDIIKNLGIQLFMESASTDRWCDLTLHKNTSPNSLCICKKNLRLQATDFLTGKKTLPDIFDFFSNLS